MRIQHAVLFIVSSVHLNEMCPEIIHDVLVVIRSFPKRRDAKIVHEKTCFFMHRALHAHYRFTDTPAASLALRMSVLSVSSQVHQKRDDG